MARHFARPTADATQYRGKRGTAGLTLRAIPQRAGPAPWQQIALAHFRYFRRKECFSGDLPYQWVGLAVGPYAA